MMANDWRELAACRGADSELFYPVGDDWAGAGNARRAEAAKAVCADCPVALSCLADAVERGDLFAVLGGTLPDERFDLVRLARSVNAA
jgi:WhiB family transcriptional regulator, redox-sensing transcriptional regulator